MFGTWLNKRCRVSLSYKGEQNQEIRELETLFQNNHFLAGVNSFIRKQKPNTPHHTYIHWMVWTTTFPGDPDDENSSIT